MTSLSLRPLSCEDLDLNSVKAICGKSEQVMVYGLKSCEYETVIQILRFDENSPFKKIFTWTTGSQAMGRPYNWKDVTTLERGDIQVLRYEIDNDHTRSFIARPCKNALTMLVLENYKRIEEGREIIPLLFCIDIDRNQDPMTMDKIASRGLAEKITRKELRRAYKLCTHPNPKIRKAAKETLKFVKMKLVKGHDYVMEQIPAPWADTKKAAKLWKARESSASSKKKDDTVNWRKQLETHIAAYDKSRKKEDSSMSSAPVPASIFSSIWSGCLNIFSCASCASESSESRYEKMRKDTSLQTLSLF